MAKHRHPLIFVGPPYRGDIEIYVRQAERFCRFVYLQYSVQEVNVGG